MKKFAFVLCLILLVCLCGGCGFNMDFYPDGKLYTAGDAFITEPVKRVEIHWRAGEVSVLPGEGESLTAIQTEKEQDAMYWLLQDGVLYIRHSASGISFNTDLNTDEKKLTVTLPLSRMPEALSVKTSSARVAVKIPADTPLQELSASSSSGDMEIEADNIRTCSLSTSSGKIHLASEDSIDTFSASSSSGDMEIEADNIRTCSLSTSSGKLRLISGNIDTFSASSSSGSMDFTANDIGDGKLSTSSGKMRLTAKESVAALSASSSSGDMEVEAGRIRSGKFSTSSGAIDCALPQTASFTATLDAASGTLESDIPLQYKNNTYICGTGEDTLHFDTSSGRVHIRQKEE